MIIQENLNTKVTISCDVLVCGGGFGGIAAALAAARQGKDVVLLDKLFMLGGLGTAGLVTIYLPLCDGLGHQVSFGIAEELLHISISLGAEAQYPANWLDPTAPQSRTASDPRFLVQYNPQLFAMLAEQLLLKEGVRILYGTYAVAAIRDGSKLSAVIVENKSGRQAIRAHSFVDATGDCDIAFLAGVPTVNFQQGNLLAAWYYDLGQHGYSLHGLGCADIPDKHKQTGHKTPCLVPKRFTGLDGIELSQMVQLSHAATLEDICKRRQDDPSLVPVTIATTPQVRMTRRIAGAYTLHDTEQHVYFEDSIGMISDWRKRGPVYEIPFSTLYSTAINNLITAGRCISVTDSMWDIMRVIPCCAVTGQAAGTAAALSDDFSALDIKHLQRVLTESGVILHEKDL